VLIAVEAARIIDRTKTRNLSEIAKREPTRFPLFLCVGIYRVRTYKEHVSTYRDKVLPTLGVDKKKCLIALRGIEQTLYIAPHQESTEIMNGLFEAICDALTWGAQQSKLDPRGLKLVGICRRECEALTPGLFTAEILLERVLRNDSRATKSEMIEILRILQQEGSAVKVGLIQNGSSHVPAYRYVGA